MTAVAVAAVAAAVAAGTGVGATTPGRTFTVESSLRAVVLAGGRIPCHPGEGPTASVR